MNIPKVPKPKNPVLFDIVISELQDVIKDNLSWIDYSFGRVQRLVTTKDKRDYHYPGVHIGSGTYLNVLPDQNLGNFSFVSLDDPQRVDFNPNTANIMRVRYSIVFWFDLSKIFPDSKDRNTEQLKSTVVELLTRKMFLKNGRVTLSNIYENPENVYRGFSLKEVDSQYMMQPFGGFRFEGEMTFLEGRC